jgi:hypothetical protein
MFEKTKQSVTSNSTADYASGCVAAASRCSDSAFLLFPVLSLLLP